MDIVMNARKLVSPSNLEQRSFHERVVELSPGAQIQLKQNAKDPVSLLVNGKLIAHGEVVVVDDKFGLKIAKSSTFVIPTMLSTALSGLTA